MEKEKFTKEEIETAKKIYCNWDDKKWTLFCDYADSLLKPETKFIDVRVEYNDSEFGISDKAIQESISNFDARNEYVTKVTELPETFTREDMIEFLRDSYSDVSYEKAFDLWLSERSKK